MNNITIIQQFVRVVDYVSIDDVLREIVNPNLAHYFDELRSHYRNGLLALYKSKKEALRAFVITGRFLSGRSAESLVEYSGMMILDFDHLGDKLPTVHKHITTDEHTFACFLSPSGDGLKVIVRVGSKPENHANMYKVVSTYYETLTQVKFDPTGRNINRLCFISYDPNLYVNEQAMPFHLPESMRIHKQLELF